MTENSESKFKMTAFSIHKASFEIAMTPLKDKNLNSNVQLNVNVSKNKASDGEMKGNADVDISFSLENEEGKFLDVKLSVIGQFEASDMDEKPFEEFVKYSGVSNLLQIARSYIITMTSQHGLTPPALLPMINLVELYKNAENKNK